uniref:Uncharacterized protein n=1 Tax=Romanomermis culicivorax TaxID=13658 RepID=A0A915HUL2_ROMCU
MLCIEPPAILHRSAPGDSSAGQHRLHNVCCYGCITVAAILHPVLSGKWHRTGSEKFERVEITKLALTGKTKYSSPQPAPAGAGFDML